MIIFNKPKKNKNYLSTVAIGKKHFDNWKKYILPNWLTYCKKHDLGLMVFDRELIHKKDRYWKKANWQRLLIGKYIIDNQINIENVCYLDTDILINFLIEKNIFKNFYKKNISVVSQFKNLPYDLDYILKSISFNRNKFYSKKYLLDSSIFMKPKDVFKFHKFKVFNNYFCSGLFVFNIKNHSYFMQEIFNKYSINFKTITGGGEEPVLNYEFQNFKKINWLNYKFQAIWIYEMAWKYPFLYELQNKKSKIIIDCIESSLMTNYFLHFAGSWYESDMWKNSKIINILKTFKNKNFSKYLFSKVFAKPKGRVTAYSVKKI